MQHILFRKRSNPNRLLVFFCFALCTLCMLSGCQGQSKKEDDQTVDIEREGDGDFYNTVTVAKGDVVAIQDIDCTFRQTLDEDISFSLSGKKIDKVYVNNGDHVVKGQLLAELKDDKTSEEIQRLEYEVAKNKLQLQYINENEKNDIDEQWAYFDYASGGSDEERVQVNKDIADLKQSNRYKREDCQDAIDLGQRELAQLQENQAACHLYASINGTVSRVPSGLEGSTSAKDKMIMKIVDESAGMFTCDQIEMAEYFQEGKAVDLAVGADKDAITYKVLPYKMNEWKEHLTFVLEDQDMEATLEIGTTGKIQVQTDFVPQVLTIPFNALHAVEGKSYVYILGEGDMREMRYVELGAEGNNSIEVKSGLAEGEKVIVQ